MTQNEIKEQITLIKLKLTNLKDITDDKITEITEAVQKLSTFGDEAKSIFKNNKIPRNRKKGLITQQEQKKKKEPINKNKKQTFDIVQGDIKSCFDSE